MIARFKVKGTCVDDLFHILANNGYQVQLSTTEVRDIYICDVIVKDLENESEPK
jgi:uncharacterized protein (DUF2126 family)